MHTPSFALPPQLERGAVDLADQDALKRIHRRAALAGLARRVHEEIDRLEERALRASARAARLPLAANSRRKLTAEANACRGMIQMLELGLAGNRTPKVQAGGPHHLQRAIRLLNDLHAAA